MEVACEHANAAKKDREAVLENYEVLGRQQDSALKQLENINMKHDVLVIGCAETKQDLDAILSERNQLAAENKCPKRTRGKRRNTERYLKPTKAC